MKTHDTDLVSLLSGLLFVVVGIVVLAGGVDLDLLDLDVAWLGPTILMVVGVGVLLSAFDRNRDDDSSRPQEVAVDAPPPDEPAVADDEPR